MAVSSAHRASDPGTFAAHPPHRCVLLASDGRAGGTATAATARRVATRLGAPLVVTSVLEPYPVYGLGDDIVALSPAILAERRAELTREAVEALEPVLGPRDRWTLDVVDGPRGRALAARASALEARLVVVGHGPRSALDRLASEDVAEQLVKHGHVPVLAVSQAIDRPLRTIVAATDFSAASVQAARTAVALLDTEAAEGARVVLVHVRAPYAEGLGLDEAPETWIAARFARLRELLRPVAPSSVTIETRTRTGVVVDEVEAVASELGAECIATGTHGPGWLERLVLGSVATDVLRRSARHVLVAPTPGVADRLRWELQMAGGTSTTHDDEFEAAVALFTRRNIGRIAHLATGSRESDRTVAWARGQHFRGATFDGHDRALSIMLGGADGAHLTHVVRDVRRVELFAQDDAHDRGLLVESGAGHVTITLD